MSVFTVLGLAPSEKEKELKRVVDNSYKNIEVVGRGGIKIDPTEVRNTEEFKTAQKKAKQLVEQQ